MSEVETIKLSPEVTAEIDAWLARYPKEERQSAVLAALRVVQKAHDDYLTEPLMDAIAAYIGVPKIAVYEVASFYSMYNLEPTGKHVFHVCTNVSCMLNGSDEVVAHLEQKLGAKLGENSTDGKYGLRHVECLGACINAPVLYYNEKYYENLTLEKIDKMLAELE